MSKPNFGRGGGGGGGGQIRKRKSCKLSPESFTQHAKYCV